MTEPSGAASLTAEIVSIGDELLHAGMIDTNSSHIAGALERLGAVVERVTVVGDDPMLLRTAIEDACRRVDVVVATGGLGPTLDDRTRDVVAELLGVEMRFDEASWQQILAWFERHVRKVPDSNRRQAELPASADALQNPVGTAPGFAVKIERATFFALPGVPREMKVMLQEHVLPAVERLGNLTPTAQMCLRVLGPSEALLGQRLADYMQPGQNPAVGITASAGLLSVRIVATAKSSSEAAELCEQTAAALRPKLGDWLIAEGLEELPLLVQRRLAAQHLTIAFAESCTGGLCAARLTDIAGSSAVLMGAVVAYSNDAKQELLGLPPDLLAEHGAVSEPVAAAMAEGALQRFGARVAVATTGIAGPGGGSEQKPVGTVCFAISHRPSSDSHATDGKASTEVSTKASTKTWTVRIPDLGRMFVRDRAVLEVWRELLL